MAVKNLEPQIVWQFFDEITAVPRPSKKEKKIVLYLENFAKKLSLDYQKDSAGNIVIRKTATVGKENSPTIVLQSHVDMVCEKNADTVFDFERDPIQAYIDNGWVRARGTTLGADCGIGMAAQMAVLASTDIPHPAIEALFTVDEETGLTGAFNLGRNMITGKYLINLDSEDEGEICIGCAGGIDTVATFGYSKESIPDDFTAYKISATGFAGGHSGDDIEKGRGNSNKIINRFLYDITDSLGARLSVFEGGNLRNAIPREAHAVFAIHKKHEKQLNESFAKFCNDITNELKHTEKKIIFSLVPFSADYIIDFATQRALVRSVRAAANGVISMSHSMDGLVETSSNLASIKFSDCTIVVTTSQRSAVDSAKYDAMNTVASAFLLGGASVEHSQGYPGWTPETDSQLLGIAERAYEELFGLRPKIRAIHAGLECGLFLKKYPDLQMISFGPTLTGVHSPDERLEISSVGKFWKLLTECLKNV